MKACTPPCKNVQKRARNNVPSSRIHPTPETVLVQISVAGGTTYTALALVRPRVVLPPMISSITDQYDMWKSNFKGTQCSAEEAPEEGGNVAGRRQEGGRRRARAAPRARPVPRVKARNRRLLNFSTQKYAGTMAHC